MDLWEYQLKNKRIFLSYPEFTTRDFFSINKTLNNLNRKPEQASKIIEKFEIELASLYGVEHAVALSSGTAAIHLGLKALNIKQGDQVIIPSLTFAATAFPVLYEGATPLFLDVDKDTWTLDLNLLESHLKECKSSDLPKLIISVDLFGRTCDYERLFEITDKYEVPVMIDSAESLGSTFNKFNPVTKVPLSIVSFNFNKIITTLGGGAILTNDNKIEILARKLSNQAREKFHWYQHNEIGFNYRISPLQAAIGVSQLARLVQTVKNRRNIRNIYVENLNDVKGIRVIQDSGWEVSNSWLTLIEFERQIFPNGRDSAYNLLFQNNIESRFVWKPLHLQPVFKKYKAILTGTSEEIYDTSLCLPSSNFLKKSEVKKISQIIKDSL
jgi:dTDP-4-amino-4,6-dideoxygalactose transaminase